MSSLDHAQKKLGVLLQQMEEMNAWVQQLRTISQSVKETTLRIQDFNKDVRIFRLDQNLKTIHLQDTIIENDLRYFIASRKFVFDYLHEELSSTHSNMYKLYLGIHRGEDTLTAQRTGGHAAPRGRRGSVLPLPKEPQQQLNKGRPPQRTAEQHMVDCRHLFQDILELNSLIQVKIQQYQSVLEDLQATKAKGYGISKLIIDLKSQIGKFMLERDILLGNLDRILCEAFELNQQILGRMLVITAYWKPDGSSLSDLALVESAQLRKQTKEEQDIAREARRKSRHNSLHTTGFINISVPEIDENIVKLKELVTPVKSLSSNASTPAGLGAETPFPTPTPDGEAEPSESIQYIMNLNRSLYEKEKTLLEQTNHMEVDSSEHTFTVKPNFSSQDVLPPFTRTKTKIEKKEDELKKIQMVRKIREKKKASKMGGALSKVMGWLFHSKEVPQEATSSASQILQEAIHNKESTPTTDPHAMPQIMQELKDDSSSSSSDSDHEEPPAGADAGAAPIPEMNENHGEDAVNETTVQAEKTESNTPPFENTPEEVTVEVLEGREEEIPEPMDAPILVEEPKVVLEPVLETKPEPEISLVEETTPEEEPTPEETTPEETTPEEPAAEEEPTPEETTPEETTPEETTPEEPTPEETTPEEPAAEEEPTPEEPAAEEEPVAEEEAAAEEEPVAEEEAVEEETVEEETVEEDTSPVVEEDKKQKRSPRRTPRKTLGKGKKI